MNVRRARSPLGEETAAWLVATPMLEEIMSAADRMLAGSLGLHDGASSIGTALSFLIPVAERMAAVRDPSLEAVSNRLLLMGRQARSIANGASVLDDDMAAVLRRWPAFLAADIDAALRDWDADGEV